MVTFVSQCEKKALKRTRRVLDAFANRIGDNTWQTVITQEGLNAVKKLLRRTASKSTAISCHWLRSRSRSELVWVVGKKSKFNSQGFVPVNYTEQELMLEEKSTMLTLDTIVAASAIAGLFHDFGKANILFQNKLDKNHKGKKYEAYRHEWVSLRLFQAFVDSADEDNKWLKKLANIESQTTIKSCIRDGLDEIQLQQNHPILSLPPFAQLVAWLIASHHKLLLYPAWKVKNSPAPNLSHANEWLENNLEPVWNSYNSKDLDIKEVIPENWTLTGLPYQSSIWRATARMFAKDTLLTHETDYLNNQLFTMHIARLCLVQSDHYYSSLAPSDSKEEWRDDSYPVWANTDKTKKYKQKLEEHLIGVACNARKIARALPKLHAGLPQLEINSKLSDRVKKDFKLKFGWQDKAVGIAQEVAKKTIETGFFGINMASTGKGKTLANAKIMTAIGEEIGRVRFSVALGLRTLTLQTGEAYRTELDIKEQLAIMLGGIAVKQLFMNEQKKGAEVEQEALGSESANSSFDDFLMDYQGVMQEHSLSKWTKNEEKLNKLIQAPVLVCTIDHLVPATEGTRGDKHIAPMLRLFTSDLVIDEPDDFNLDDLPALCRLVNWAGMLGSRVLLSTATMPPALANALFRAYKAGWCEYAKANLENWNGEISCAWFDEYHSEPKTISCDEEYKKTHDGFVKKRIQKLQSNTQSKHLGKILNIDESSDKSPIEKLSESIFSGINQLHNQHKITQGGKNISIGLVRMANINPLVAIAKLLLQKDAPENTCIHYCVYHSKFPLAIRSHIESKLDRILQRKNQDAIWKHEEIQDKIENSNVQHHIFVVLASPVAEVGRDHDYDWAIIEPSSMRSIIQTSGRVLRHRDIFPKEPNIFLLNKNYKALKAGKLPYFQKPGFETEKIRMQNYDLNNILQEKQYKNISSSERIILPDSFDGSINNHENLVNLEHKALQNTLFAKEYGARLWWENNLGWSGEMQRQQKFRKSQKDTAYYLWLSDEYSPITWRAMNEEAYPPKWSDDPTDPPKFDKTMKDLCFGTNSGFWFEIEVKNIYQELGNDFKLDLPKVSERFGEVHLVEYENTSSDYKFHPILGVYQIIEEQNNE